MSSDLHEPRTDVEGILADTLELSTRLHPAIAVFDESEGRYALAAEPGVAFFHRPDADTITHASSSPSPALVPVLEELHQRHLEIVGVPKGGDNSHVWPLLLLCLYLADPASGQRFELDMLAKKPAEVVALDEEQGRHDPELEVGDSAFRAWMPLGAEHAPEAGVQPAILELRFHMDRYERYAPW